MKFISFITALIFKNDIYTSTGSRAVNSINKVVIGTATLVLASILVRPPWAEVGGQSLEAVPNNTEQKKNVNLSSRIIRVSYIHFWRVSHRDSSSKERTKQRRKFSRKYLDKMCVKVFPLFSFLPSFFLFLSYITTTHCSAEGESREREEKSTRKKKARNIWPQTPELGV